MRPVEVKQHRQHTVRVEAGVYLLNPNHAAHHQSSAHQQDERDGDLDHDQDAAQSNSRDTARRTTRPLTHACRQRSPRPERRNQAEEQTRAQRHHQREEQHRAVDRDLPRARREPLGESNQQIEAGHGEAEANEPAEQSDQRGLGQHESDQPATRRAEGRTHGQLPLAALDPSQRQVGDIGTRDQQYQADRREQQQEGRPCLPREVIHSDDASTV